jgi:hypothetical protein
MARTVAQPGALELLEQGAHLLRSASLDTLLCHLAGSVPLVLGLLLAWNAATHPPLGDAAAAAWALALALLLIWMNCWRSVFAGRLHCDLRGAPPMRWNPCRILRLIAAQALPAATKPLLLPLALIAGFAFPSAMGAYRNMAVLGATQDLDALALLRQARRLERGSGLGDWLLLLLLFVLSLVVILNVAVALMVLPQLTRMFTGVESAFTRDGTALFRSRLFILFVLALAWMLFDPYVQAVYTLRCFHRESVETAEDLRAGLRRLASAARAASPVLALLLVIPFSARAIDQTDLDRAARQAMQAPEYNWRLPQPASAASSSPWIVTATDRALAAMQSAIRWAGDMLDRFVRWLFGKLDFSPTASDSTAPSTALHWSVWAALALGVMVVIWFLWRARAARRTLDKRPSASAASVQLDADDLNAARLPEDGWLEMAERCLHDGDRRLALRAFYLASLAWLGHMQLLSLDAGKTNREFEIELARRARWASEAHGLFHDNVRAFERAWYGLHDVAGDDISAFRLRAGRIKQTLRQEDAV